MKTKPKAKTKAKIYPKHKASHFHRHEVKQLQAEYGTAGHRGSSEHINQTRLGLPASDLIKTARMVGMSRDAFYATVGLPKSTIERNISQQSPLSPAHGDRLYRVNRVFARALEVLEDDGAAKLWVRRANRSLAGESPLAMLDTEAGYELVLDTLGQIEFGIAA